MAGIPSGEGSGGAQYRNTFTERFPAYPTSLLKFFHQHKDLLVEMLSDLSHLPIHERMDAVRKKLKERELSKAPSVHSSDDEEDEDEDEEDDEEEDEDEHKEDMEGARLKLIDDEKKPRRAEEHQVHSERERECKKPRFAECVEKPDAREPNNQDNP